MSPYVTCAGAFNAVCACVCLCFYLINTPARHPRPSQQGSTKIQGESTTLQRRIHHRLFWASRGEVGRTHVDAASRGPLRGHKHTHAKTGSRNHRTATSTLFLVRLIPAILFAIICFICKKKTIFTSSDHARSKHELDVSVLTDSRQMRKLIC